jgi:hypothetical protein
VISLSIALGSVDAKVCPCDCDGNGHVPVSELVVAVRISLGNHDLSDCPAADANDDSTLAIDDLVTCVNAALHGCSAPTPTPRPGRAELEQARQEWESTAPRGYRFLYTLNCLCPGPRRVEIRVVDDVIVQILDPENGEPIRDIDPANYRTIPQLFDLIEEALDTAHSVLVDYSAGWGAPRGLFIDYLDGPVDDEIGIQVGILEPFFGDTCRDSGDCESSAGECIEPGGFIGCGICVDFTPECTSDDDCSGEVSICAPVGIRDCACSPGVLRCRVGCRSDSGCELGQICDSAHHCVPRKCGPDMDCPSHFGCVLPAGECRRLPCTNDDTCSNGYCVNAECHPYLGTCELPPPLPPPGGSPSPTPVPGTCVATAVPESAYFAACTTDPDDLRGAFSLERLPPECCWTTRARRSYPAVEISAPSSGCGSGRIEYEIATNFGPAVGNSIEVLSDHGTILAAHDLFQASHCTWTPVPRTPTMTPSLDVPAGTIYPKGQID